MIWSGMWVWKVWLVGFGYDVFGVEDLKISSLIC